MKTTEQCAKEISKILKDNNMKLKCNWADPSVRVEVGEDFETYLDDELFDFD